MVFKRISKYLKDQGIKQKAVAEKAGFSEQQFSAMMNGNRKILAEDIADICKALGKEPNDFILINSVNEEDDKE
ncbi:helix-turn-helix transcriptional regulator [Clostridia bacterium]|nr:helix-turn-helix transcriptional regulator [Clostridia bacterium]